MDKVEESDVPVAPVAPRVQTKPRLRAADMAASQDIHTEVRPSPLSSEAPPQNFRGLYNLAGITLVVMNFRLVMENLLKYGLLISMPTADWRDWPKTWPCLSCSVGLLLLPAFSHVVERAAWGQKSFRAHYSYLHIPPCLALLLFPILVIRGLSAAILPGIVLLFQGVIMSMKLTSYAHVNHDLRRRHYCPELYAYCAVHQAHHLRSSKCLAYKTSSGHKGSGHSPAQDDRPGLRRRTNKSDTGDRQRPASTDSKSSDLKAPTALHLAYFMLAPTLVYQVAYPRTARIRIRFVLRRVAEALFCWVLIVFIVEQYVMPLVRNSVDWLDTHPNHTPVQKAVYLLERLFKLAIPNGMIWLLGFYATFHSGLNLLAEVLRFGDRGFYKDWWNAESLDVYWRTWNLPVHNWLVRHVYAPLLRRGYNRMHANMLVFLLSALMHEVLVSIPCHMNNLWAFWGMVAQIPLIILTRFVVKRFHAKVWGNVLFWTTFLVFGQPAAVMLYYHSYVRGQTQMMSAST